MTNSRGGRIKEMLDSRGMTARELAIRIGVTEVSMSRYVNDERTPKADMLAKIAQALGTTIDYLENGRIQKTTPDERRKLINKIADFYGPAAQCDIAIEEATELIKAICKNKRADNAEDFGRTRDNIIEEIADVQIMLLQLIDIFDCGPDVAEMVDNKIERQLTRIRAKEAKNASLYIGPDDGGGTLQDDL